MSVNKYTHAGDMPSTEKQTCLYIRYLNKNITGLHRAPNRKLRAGYRAPSLQRTSYVAMRFHRQVWYCALSLSSACNQRSGIIFIPLGYPCVNFRFFGGLYCWASSCRKIAYSLSHSLTHSLTQSPSLLDAPGTEVFASE